MKTHHMTSLDGELWIPYTYTDYLCLGFFVCVCLFLFRLVFKKG